MLRLGPFVRLVYRKMEEMEFNIRVLVLKDKMFRFARSILLRRDEAEDVIHDTLVRLWLRRGRLGECRDIEAFVMTSVRNGCYDRLRRSHIRAGEPLAELSAEEETTRRDARDTVALAMALLPAKQREVLHLKEIEGYATHEIAAMYGVEENQIRTLLSRARKGLRAAIEKENRG